VKREHDETKWKGGHDETERERGLRARADAHHDKLIEMIAPLYQPPFAFTGTIFKVVADVSGQMLQDTEEERKASARAALSRQ